MKRDRSNRRRKNSDMKYYDRKRIGLLTWGLMLLSLPTLFFNLMLIVFGVLSLVSNTSLQVTPYMPASGSLLLPLFLLFAFASLASWLFAFIMLLRKRQYYFFIPIIHILSWVGFFILLVSIG